MNWHVITVPMADLGLALGAIGLAGGTVIKTLPSASEVAITYVTTGGRSDPTGSGD